MTEGRGSNDRREGSSDGRSLEDPGEPGACPAVLGQDLQGGPSSSLSFKNTELDPAPQEALAQAVTRDTRQTNWFEPIKHKCTDIDVCL